ncbi:galactose-specific lectin nattectin-like [Syngnathoides biaculeatus]|uniref:galactose-specific lectin nattectin-like n=1 Tax=Syngnathoides biaculeatus TaxID=300417 RepID=UPI002ADDCA21|nr:galactose-specific lectin nattectin-like [Syngnathoides biaculeatus]
MRFGLLSLLLLCGISELLTGAWSRPTKEVQVHNSCPKGWTQLDCNCYLYQDEGRTFADAESVCNILGGNLVSIHSALENSFVLELIRQSSKKDKTWIGLHDAIEDNDFIWTDGSDVDFLRFDDHEPNGSGPCVQIDERNGFWEDAYCADELSYVCIRDVPYYKLIH